MSSVVFETESRRSIADTGVFVGLTVYEDGDRYRVVLRNRRYDGLRVSSRWDSGPIALGAAEVPYSPRWAAIREGVGHANAFARSMRGSDG